MNSLSLYIRPISILIFWVIAILIVYIIKKSEKS